MKEGAKACLPLENHTWPVLKATHISDPSQLLFFFHNITFFDFEYQPDSPTMLDTDTYHSSRLPGGLHGESKQGASQVDPPCTHRQLAYPKWARCLAVALGHIP